MIFSCYKNSPLYTKSLVSIFTSVRLKRIYNVKHYNPCLFALRWGFFSTNSNIMSNYFD